MTDNQVNETACERCGHIFVKDHEAQTVCARCTRLIISCARLKPEDITELDYQLCDYFSITIDELDILPLDYVESLRCALFGTICFMDSSQDEDFLSDQMEDIYLAIEQYYEEARKKTEAKRQSMICNQILNNLPSWNDRDKFMERCGSCPYADYCE